MKKVLFVATVTRQHINIFHIPYLKWFKEQGYEVHVASRGEDPIAFCDVHYNLPFERFPFKKNNLKVYKELKKIINNNNYQIIHCHTPVGGVLARLAARKARKNGVKVIYTAHGFHFFKGAPLINWLIYYPIEKIMSKYTDCLITINQEDYKRAKKKFKKVKQIELVHGIGVNENKFDIKMTEEEKMKLRENLKLKKDDFVIIYPAELSKRKNQAMLLKAISLLKQKGYKNIKVILPGDDSMNGVYQKMAKNLDIEKEVEFLGYRNDIPQLMKISNLAVSTSKQEGLPVNLIEAKMSGLPIIGTNCRGNRDVANELVEINNVKGLRDKIEQFINKDLVILEQNDKQKYQIENVMREMSRIYEQYL